MVIVHTKDANWSAVTTVQRVVVLVNRSAGVHVYDSAERQYKENLSPAVALQTQYKFNL